MTTPPKVSPALQLQVNLRKQQLASPTSERLAQMRSTGMDIANIGLQRIYIHLNQRLTAEQAGELESAGITIYHDSWIPPVGAQPTGFYLADMPIDRLAELAEKDYIVRLDTSERLAGPEDIPGRE